MFMFQNPALSSSLSLRLSAMTDFTTYADTVSVRYRTDSRLRFAQLPMAGDYQRTCAYARWAS